MLFTWLSVPGLLLMVLVLLSISNTKIGSKPFCQGGQRREKGEKKGRKTENHLKKAEGGKQNNPTDYP